LSAKNADRSDSFGSRSLALREEVRFSRGISKAPIVTLCIRRACRGLEFEADPSESENDDGQHRDDRDSSALPTAFGSNLRLGVPRSVSSSGSLGISWGKRSSSACDPLPEDPFSFGSPHAARALAVLDPCLTHRQPSFVMEAGSRGTVTTSVTAAESVEQNRR
jgi:hypothetical protein